MLWTRSYLSVRSPVQPPPAHLSVLQMDLFTSQHSHCLLLATNTATTGGLLAPPMCCTPPTTKRNFPEYRQALTPLPQTVQHLLTACGEVPAPDSPLGTCWNSSVFALALPTVGTEPPPPHCPPPLLPAGFCFQLGRAWEQPFLIPGLGPHCESPPFLLTVLSPSVFQSPWAPKVPTDW